MFDIEFFMKAHELKKSLIKGEAKLSFDEALKIIEGYRSKTPVIYNIETTNACNMRCKMCPRTTMMTRPIEAIDPEIFAGIIDQLKPFSSEQLKKWSRFVESEYGIKESSVSENHFFLHIIPKVLQLHGYGEPLLDKNMPLFVRILAERGFLTYFSCNPSNINVEKVCEIFKSGLTYIKFSMEATDDDLHKQIRGKASDFSGSFQKILELIRLKEKYRLGTKVIITMLNLNRSSQIDEFEKLKKSFAGVDAYIYLKSEDQLWYRKDYHCTKSVHWSEFCQHPWMSMTIKSNAEVVMCMEDFNNEIILGDSRKESLYDIWNGKKYRDFRLDHFNLTTGMKCTEHCDMKLIGNFIAKPDVCGKDCLISKTPAKKG